MKKDVMLTIRGKQFYLGQMPETVELVTEGIMERTENGWQLTYEESDLTGMEGVTTAFSLEPGRITLIRTGKLNSQMVFEEGVSHESLYQTEFGALMMTVCATHARFALSEEGGTVDMNYTVDIEQSVAGMVEYHLDVKIRQ